MRIKDLNVKINILGLLLARFMTNIDWQKIWILWPDATSGSRKESVLS